MSSAWKECFAAVLAEWDSERLPDLIAKARKAIMERIEQLLADPDHQPEHDEILAALSRLALLEKVVQQKRATLAA